ncbi:ATP-binding protein [Streptomyces tateyamensis]|uniref:ATP-binding protein n=1 Tax=Streptomyces tateyamensis TaxID=565073 RepID=UPI0011B48E21|nr:ATP-binding protein [Streptomyces tateyamensis]
MLLADGALRTLRVSVADECPALPEQRACSADPYELSGRGLHLVRSLTHRFGAAPHERGGKTGLVRAGLRRVTAARREPFAPTDPALLDYTDAQIAGLIRELQQRGEKFGLRWGSARTNGGSVDGHALVKFGNAPVSTLLNLLALVGQAEGNGTWES